MASESTSQEAELLEKGFLELNDPKIGHLLDKIEDQYLFSLPGLEFLKSILHNPSIVKIAGSLLGPCKLGHWLKYIARPGHIEGWSTSGKDARIRVLLVLAMAKGSRIIFYQGSHLQNIPVQKNILTRGLPETTRTALDSAGCVPVEKDYPNGALVVIDARLFREIETGHMIKHALAADDALTGWVKLKIPEVMKKKIEDIQSTIGINFEIDSSTDSTSS